MKRTMMESLQIHLTQHKSSCFTALRPNAPSGHFTNTEIVICSLRAGISSIIGVKMENNNKKEEYVRFIVSCDIPADIVRDLSPAQLDWLVKDAAVTVGNRIMIAYKLSRENINSSGCNDPKKPGILFSFGVPMKNLSQIELHTRQAVNEYIAIASKVDRSRFVGGSGFGLEVDILIDDLINIGRSDGFMSVRAGGKFNQQCKHMRVLEIGIRLNQLGGLELMQVVFEKVRNSLGISETSTLNCAWDGIGKWQM